MIDSFTVIRCKAVLPTDCSTEHYGTRTDHVVVRPGGGAYQLLLDKDKAWFFPYEGNGLPDWVQYWKRYCPALRKYSHGLAAAFLAMQLLSPEALYVIGYDRLLGRFETAKSWETRKEAYQYTLSAHDWEAENRALHGLGVPIIELTRATCPNFSNTTPTTVSAPTPPSMKPRAS